MISAFIWIGTNPRLFEQPLSLEEAIHRVQGWIAQPCTRLMSLTPRHWDVFGEMLTQGQETGNLVFDTHLAALAVEHGCELCSTDTEFSWFRKLKWRNPLSG